MAQTLSTLNTKLTTHAATAGANKFIMGYIEDIHELRDQATTYYPVIEILPLVLKDSHDTEVEEFTTLFDISVYYEFNRNKLTIDQDYVIQRIVAWAAANVIGKAFILAVSGDANITVLDSVFDVTLYPEGATLENTVVVNYKINVKISC
ncbi:MAG: hypothetical protein HQ541_17990 [Mariniphaga sp.]|nr:hypothetical protein [Mariniphaga sp.]